jgi:hypothetical protein
MTQDPEMRRTQVSVTATTRARVRDFAADYALDAAEAGVDPDAVASALREAADAIEYQAREDNIATNEEVRER